MLKLNGLTLTYFSSHTGKLQMLKAVLFAVVPNYKLELNTIKISLSQPHEPHFKSAQEPHMATTLDSRDIKISIIYPSVLSVLSISTGL